MATPSIPLKRETTFRDLITKTFQRKDAIREFRKIDRMHQEETLRFQALPLPIIGVPATAPERMVYHFLLRLQIPFQFQYPVPEDLSFLSDEFEYDITNWRPDFLIPDHKIWIEVHGSYWHTQPGRVEKDNFKAAVVTIAGWKYVEWWDWEIMRNLAFLFQRDCPELLRADRATGLPAPYLLDAEAEEKAMKAREAEAKSHKVVRLWRERDPYYSRRRAVKIRAYRWHDLYRRPREFKLRPRERYEEPRIKTPKPLKRYFKEIES